MTTPAPGRYLRALEAHFEASLGHPQYDVWFRYAADTNARGRDLLAQLERSFGPVAGLRVLDIGSGYGGTCIAAASAGARDTVGLELSPVQMRLARENLGDHPGLAIALHEVDVLDRAATGALGRFELITCDNVLEHVGTPAALLGRVRELLADGGRAYVTVPNAFSLGQVRRDCHYGLLGISLLEPFSAARYAAEAAGIAHYDVSQLYRLESYLALLERLGLRGALLNPSVGEGGLEDARAELAALRGVAFDGVPTAARSQVAAQVKVLVEEVEACLSAVDALEGPQRSAAARDFLDAYAVERWELAVWRPGPAEVFARRAAARVSASELGRRVERLLRGR